MTEAPQGRRETLAIVILSYGVLGGLLSSFACCCWPGSIFVAWAATRRVSNMGLLPPGSGGAAFGLRIGLVMGLVMASFGGALALVQTDAEQMAVIQAGVGEVPFSLVAVMMVVMLGSVGLVAGVVGGALGASGSSTREPRGPHRPPRRASAGPSSEAPPPQKDAAGAGTPAAAPLSKPPAEVGRRLQPEDFVTAEREPGPARGDREASSRESRNAEVTITIDEDTPRPETELAEWRGDQEDDGVEDSEPGDDS